MESFVINARQLVGRDTGWDIYTARQTAGAILSGKQCATIRQCGFTTETHGQHRIAVPENHLEVSGFQGQYPAAAIIC